MRRAQGKPRSKPDGYLHIQNFSVTKPAGLAGALYLHVLNKRQQEIVENALVELAEKLQTTKDLVMWKHDCWRFDKQFLIDNFKKALYGTFKLIRKNSSEQAAIAINREYLQTERLIVRYT